MVRDLVGNPKFADTVDDIVMEFGNSRYQRAVDRYVSGENVPLEEVQGAWRDTVASVGPPSPVYASLYQAVREANLKRRGNHRICVLCGDPRINWQQINQGSDIVPFLRTREQSYAGIVEKEVIAGHHRALLIMGAFHFLRHFPARQPGSTLEESAEALLYVGSPTSLSVVQMPASEHVGTPYLTSP